MNIKTINKLKEYNMFLFIPYKDKLDIIKNQQEELDIRIKLIKSLNQENKKNLLIKIFSYESINLTNEELIKIFQSLTYKDKILVCKSLEEEPTKYLEYFSKKELFDTVIYENLNGKTITHIIDNLLTQKDRLYLYKTQPLHTNSIIQIIKHFDDDYRRKIILKKHGQIKKLYGSAYKATLCYLPTVEEKLIYLDDNNKYKIKLDIDEKINLIITTNDEEKIKFLRKNQLHDYNSLKILNSLTDIGKLYFINNKAELNEYIPYYKSEFYSSFSRELAKKVIRNREQYIFNESYIEFLIERLTPEERLDYVLEKNNDNLILKSYQKKRILMDLPEQFKIDILKNNNINNITLNKEYKILLASKINIKNLIEILIKHPEQYYKFETEDMWKIIESKDKKAILYLLEKEDKDIKDFIEKYKTSIVKCLDDQDKIDILYNKSKYGIHLEDNRKLKILKTLILNNNTELFEENIFNYFDNPQKVIDKLFFDKKEFNLLNDKLKQYLIEFYTGKKDDPEFINIYLNVLKYTDNAKEILEHFNKFQLIFNKLNINLLDFIQYGINSNKYKWDIAILNIIKNNKLESFTKVKNYFFNNYYIGGNHKKNTIENFLELLNAYNEYELLCNNITNENKQLTESNKMDIQYIFDTHSKDNPKTIEEIQKIRDEKIKTYKIIAENNHSIYSLKEALLKLFFGKDLYTLSSILSNTGGVKELNILKFNNKNNKEYSTNIEHVILITEFIERIIKTNDISGLRELLKKYSDEGNLEETKKYINYFSKYEQFIRKIYELDIQISLTNINSLDDSFTNTDKANALSKQYGGKVIDLSESNYVLIGHVKSRKESIDNLLTGTSDGNSNFICTSPVSHRGQHYYAYNKYSIVFAYDNIPKDSFICSSIDNLGSNHILNHNTSEVPEFSRKQKGILETSEAASHKNAEMLLYREGLKPCGIIIPTGTIPSEDAIEYHQKYNIPFIITQEIDTTIENPKIIPSSKTIINIDDIEDISIPKINAENNKERKIAILTDSHALYEPTIACLADIKSKGITEIYSLGDNIGHGPSPKETLDLLKQYNVKSILGNHELYVIEDDAMEIFKQHLISKGALERTIDMTNWIKNEITEEQYEEIKKYKDKYELIAPNGEKITLIHSTEPYNSEGKYSKKIELKDSDIIIKGHEHFADEYNNNHTIRAVGIGQSQEDDGKATYAILTLKEDENQITIHNVPYNRSNLLHTINESTMPIRAKSLIKNWVGNNN